jgi:uncharacterized Zn-binding protein involved in type VI secretion
VVQIGRVDQFDKNAPPDTIKVDQGTYEQLQKEYPQLAQGDLNELAAFRSAGLRGVALVGYGTDHGGMVVSGSPGHRYSGSSVARFGDYVNCPQYYPDGRPHGVNQIVEGSTKMMVDGRPIALVGHHTGCGSKIIQGPPGGGGAPVPNAPPPSNETDKEKKDHLFGDKRPDLEQLHQNQNVRAASDQAWQNTLNTGRENGFWVVKDPNTGQFGVVWGTPTSDGMATQLPARPENAVASFHTHPARLPGTPSEMGNNILLMPSGGDVSNAPGAGVGGMIRTSVGMYFYGPQNSQPIYPNGGPDMSQATYTPQELANQPYELNATGDSNITNRDALDRLAREQKATKEAQPAVYRVSS